MGRHSAPTKRELRAAATAATTAERPAARATRAGRPRWTGTRLRRLAAVGAGTAVLGTTVGFVGLGKQVDVVIDGRQQTVTTYASDVEGVLVDAGVKATAQDAVTPSLDSSVTDGATISLIKSRELTVVIDGERTTKNVTAYTAAEAIEQLGLSDHLLVSSRAARLPLHDAQIELASYDKVTIDVDGAQQTIETAARDVEGALQDAGITLGELDTVSPAPTTPVTTGMAIAVTRVGEHAVTETRPIPYQTIEQADPNQYVGLSTVLTPGADGVETVTITVSTVNGVETSRTETATAVTTAPVNAVISKGAKEFPANVNALNWQALGYCESTNNPKAVNKTNGKYFGEYQFSVATWAGVGGSGNPADAAPEEQLARAKMLYMKYGAGQWECGSHLYD